MGSDVPGASLSRLRSPVPVEARAGDTDGSQGIADEVGGLRDPAIEVFKRDAARRGQGLSQYLRDAGILTKHQEALIRQREVPLQDVDG